ncbi:hypothetical protein Q1695_006943 [Nippostrongylus brasiliensis]|nr:hypothetical protein Q1695_006943 [Nippostrongylus brasiliensis]
MKKSRTGPSPDREAQEVSVRHVSECQIPAAEVVVLVQERLAEKKAMRNKIEMEYDEMMSSVNALIN